MRKGFDGLCATVKNEFALNPLSGDVFIFISRRKDKIKLLQWQGDGLAIFSKRLEKGTFDFSCKNSSATATEISSQQLLLLLEGIQLCGIKKQPRYENFNVDKFLKQNIEKTQA